MHRVGNASDCIGEPLWECVKSALLGMQGSSLLIFDWDDTLLPTSALEDAGYLGNGSEENQLMPTNVRSNGSSNAACGFVAHELAACDLAASRVVRAAQELGIVLIVTNSNHGWVHATAARFLPELAKELARIPVISARSIFEPQGICLQQWKVLCFERIVQCFNSRSVGAVDVCSLVSIGDSIDEEEATMAIAQRCLCYAKALKLTERPNMCTVTQQLVFCLNHLSKMSVYSGNLHVDLTDFRLWQWNVYMHNVFRKGLQVGPVVFGFSNWVEA